MTRTPQSLLHTSDIASRAPNVRDMLSSTGPIADAFILSAEEIALINGPPGSAKTTACAKKALIEATRVPPWHNGVRRYVLGVWRQKYDNLWDATIPSWNRIFPKDMPGSTWIGARPRMAEHTIRWKDQWGEVELVARFRAFGDVADPQDLKGLEYTDLWLNEMDTLPEDLFTWLMRAKGREPTENILGRPGRIYGDCNAPNTESWVYRDFFEEPKPGYRLFRQPGGREPGAENMMNLGPNYYHQIAKLNAHRPWWVRLMVDNKPGFTRDGDLVFPTYDDDRMLDTNPPKAAPEIPVLVGVDGGMTPAATYAQEMPDGQFRVLAEVALERADESILASHMLALEARLFRGCEFSTTCDPAMCAGEDLPSGSMRSRLEKALGRKVSPAPTNDVLTRISWVADKMALTLSEGRPGFVLNAGCKTIRKGLNQQYCWAHNQNTKQRSRVQDGFTTHVIDGMQYAAGLCGTALARRLASARKAEAMNRRNAARNKPRYSPFNRRTA